MPDGSLWDYAVAYYGGEGVSEACLDLQDRLNVDVPFLIFGAWAGLGGIALSDADIARLDAAVLAWREQVIHPLRAMRRQLKSGPAPAPNVETGKLRDAVKAAELKAERIEIDLLETLSAKLSADDKPSPAEAVAANLNALVAHFGGDPSEVETASTVSLLTGVALTFQV